jgi:hypothetical protein
MIPHSVAALPKLTHRTQAYSLSILTRPQRSPPWHGHEPCRARRAAGSADGRAYRLACASTTRTAAPVSRPARRSGTVAIEPGKSKVYGCHSEER